MSKIVLFRDILVVILIILCVLNQSFAKKRVKRQNYRCVTPDNYYGQCVILPYCPSLVSYFGAQGGSPHAIAYIKAAKRSCGLNIIDGQPVVCCNNPQFPTPNRNTTPKPQPPRRTTTRKPTTTTSVFIPTFPQTTRSWTLVPTTKTSIMTTRITTTTPFPTTEDFVVPKQNIAECEGPSGEPGECIDITQCPVIIEQLKSDRDNSEFKRFLRDSNKKCQKGSRVICCPVAITETPTIGLLTPEKGCARVVGNFKKVIGGEDANKGSMPWMALLGYRDGLGEISFKCGGSLITSKHVVTAAHCIKNNLKIIRLGEHDLSTELETNHIDIPIKEGVQHPGYERFDGHSDVAIVSLERNVAFTDNIKPICIPLDEKMKRESFVDYHPFIAGWGKTQEGGESSDILQFAQIEIFKNSVCQQRYAENGRFLSQRQFDNATICAGSSGKISDTCQGDSGGPLILPRPLNGRSYYFLIGVVSYGIGCARAGIPSVYTSIQYFSDWIQEKIAETL